MLRYIEPYLVVNGYVGNMLEINTRAKAKYVQPKEYFYIGGVIGQELSKKTQEKSVHKIRLNEFDWSRQS